MRNASRNPRVVTSSVRAPVRSSNALVATVVPILMAPTRFAGIGSEGERPRRLRMPCTAASRYASGFSDSSLWETNEPSGLRPITSVKVPPRSIQKSQTPASISALPPHWWGPASVPAGPQRHQPACKPGSVWRGFPHVTTIHLRRRLPGASSNLPGRPDPDIDPECPRERVSRRPYSVLLPVGFTMPLPLPAARCALTAPFHPCRSNTQRAAAV